jgi:hypothetical protein
MDRGAIVFDGLSSSLCENEARLIHLMGLEG